MINLAAPTAPLRITAGKGLFITHADLSTQQGTLRRYNVNAEGLAVAPPAAWDAAALMTTAQRHTQLYATANNARGITLFNDLDSTAFALASGDPHAEIIKAYTIDPSYDSGKYLAGRADGTLLAPLRSRPALLTPPRDLQLFADPHYKTYAQQQRTRPPRVLALADDGFLYAFDEATGALAWGWLPREWAPLLKDYAAFQSVPSSVGAVRVLDAWDGTAYAGYVIGTARAGTLHFSLKLTADAHPGEVIWTHIGNRARDDKPTLPSVLRTPSATYAVYISDDILYLRHVSNGNAITLNLGLPLTTVKVIEEMAYLGDAHGKVYALQLTAPNKDLLSATAITKSLQMLGNFNPTTTEPVYYIGQTYYHGQRHLRVQGPRSISVINPGAGVRWHVTFATPQTTITDEAFIVDGAVIVPTTTTQTSPCTLTAQLRMLRIADGALLDRPLTTPGSNPFTIGAGMAWTPALSFVQRQGLLHVLSSQQIQPATLPLQRSPLGRVATREPGR